MDFLVRFWDEKQNLVTNRHLTPLFARATAPDITGMLMSIQEEGNYNLT